MKMWEAFIMLKKKFSWFSHADNYTDSLGKNSLAIYIYKFSTIKHLNNFSENLSKINYSLYFCTEVHI